MHLFNPASASRGLILLAPGGGQDHTTPGIVARATRLTDEGYAVAVVRSLDEVPAVLAGHPGPVGFWGISQGARVGLPLLAAEPRITAAVLGLADGPLTSARWSLPLCSSMSSPTTTWSSPTPVGCSSTRSARQTRP